MPLGEDNSIVKIGLCIWNNLVNSSIFYQRDIMQIVSVAPFIIIQF